MVDLLELYTFGISSGSTDSVDNYTHLGLLTSQCMDLQTLVELLTELQMGTTSLEMRLDPNMQQTILNLNLDWLLLKSSCSSLWSSSTEIVEI